ncbi:intermediate conductance calcium-activated potassium channel protein 4 isoform X1 [Anguilla anguilla]|uniref:intermediate conductance calcium-activated potassium channel protein 4 isoform X1 n=2 Tax=Anguilla anguilla TaxID=7936 RepID=UPI0015AE218D|nr:intermediate conductance calcium-activated potassium channel protein 4 isoform X1 [Anguilla anguilla]
MTGEEEVKVGKSSFAVLCLPATGGRVRSVLMEDKERTKQQKAATAKNQLRGNPHSHAMEMTARNLHPNSKADGKNCDCSSNRNGGDTTEITVPLSPLGKRFLPIEGDNLYRLRDRKFLLEDKKRLCAWALGIALLGILLMILHTELCPVIYLPSSVYAFTITCMISLSTGCLLFLIVAFHYKDIRLFTIDHNQVDWRIAMTSQRLLGISLELVVCAIHPIAIYWGPEMGTPGLAVDSAQGGQAGTQGNFSSRPLCSSIRNSDLLDLVPLLSCLMFLRLYLVHRAIHLHSKVLLNVSYRSIGSLNNINFTFRFVLKVLMNKYPGRTLLVFIVFLWVSASWLLTLCERQIRAETGDMLTALWLIAITFLTVGYGDVSPKTLCGKMVCLFTGVMGVACTAMLVAVVAKWLALNKGEKHVHYFMMDIQISKRLRHAAANVLRECWLMHRVNCRKQNRGEHRQQQRSLLEAIRKFRHLRLNQRKLRDYASEMVDLPKMQMIMCDLSAKWNSSYHELEQRIVSMEQKLDELGRCLNHTSEILAQAVHQHRGYER